MICSILARAKILVLSFSVRLLPVILAFHVALAKAEVRGSIDASVGAGLDSNPNQIAGDTSPTVWTPFLGFSSTAQAEIQPTDSQLTRGSWDLGLRQFAFASHESLLANSIILDHSISFGPAQIGLGASGKLRLSRSKARDDLDFGARAFLDYEFTQKLSGHIGAGARRFIYWPNRDYDSFGPQIAVSLNYALDRRHSFLLGAVGGLPKYRGTARDSIAGQSDADPNTARARRSDRELGFEATYAYRGPGAIKLGYIFAQTRSNSFGEENDRHRIWVTGATHLIGNLVGAAKAAYEIVRYPQGLYLSEDLLLLNDESQSSVALQLTLPLGDRIELEGKYALYWISLPRLQDEDAPPRYVRNIAFVGVGAHW